MELENQENSIFTDRTNTIPKGSQVRHIFTKSNFTKDQDFSETHMDSTTGLDNNFKNLLTHNFATSITPTKTPCTKLKLTDDGEIIRNKPH